MMAVPATACQPAEEPAALAPSGLEERQVSIVTQDGQTHQFTVEVAETAEAQSRGLMFRESLADDRGMIFTYDEPRVASFWMRNTYIPLDMIFIRADDTIARIEANTLPLSETPYSSLEPVTKVLELRGGRAAELGIEVGDRLRF